MTGTTRSGMRLALATARRFGIWIVLITVLAATAAFALAQSAPNRYAADAQVLTLTSAVQISRPDDLTVAQAMARNFAVLARSDGVLIEGARDAGVTKTLVELREGIRITPSRDSFYLTIGFVDADPRVAVLLANGVTRAFLARAQTVQGELQRPLIESVRGEISSLSEQVRTVDQRIDALLKLESQGGSTDTSSALVESTIRQQTIATLLTLRASLVQRLDQRNQDLRIAVARLDAAVVWQPALVPQSPEPRGLLGLVSSIAATVLVLAFLGAALLQALSERALDVSTSPPAVRSAASGHSTP